MTTPSRAALRRALDAGVNWIDTAPLYGQGQSEEALGWLLAEIDDAPYLSTKVGLDLDGLDDIAGQVERSMAESLERLGRSSVDLLQLHNAIGPETGNGRIGVDRVLGPGGVADALDRLRDQGLTRFTGLTALGNARRLSGRHHQRPLRFGADLLQPSQPERRPDDARCLDRARLLRSRGGRARRPTSR